MKPKSILGEVGGSFSECHGRWAITCCVSSEMNERAGAQKGFVKMDFVSSDSGNYSDE